MGPGQPGLTGDRYEPFRRELIAKLLALRHPETGGRLVRRALTREEAFPGEANAAAPDVTLIMADYGFLSVLPSDRIVQRRPEPWGTHYPEGIFIARGVRAVIVVHIFTFIVGSASHAVVILGNYVLIVVFIGKQRFRVGILSARVILSAPCGPAAGAARNPFHRGRV